MNLKTFISASMLVTLGMIAGRLLGMVREMTMAAHFGTGHLGDMAILLLLIPDFIANMFIATTIGNTLVPAFAERTPEKAVALFWQSLALAVAVFSVFVVVLSWVAPWLLMQFHAADTIAPELSITLYSIPFAVAAWVITAYLQHVGKFLVPSFANVIFNVILIAFLWFGTDSLHWLTIGIFTASFVRLIPHVAAFLRNQAATYRRSMAWEIDGKLLKIYALAVGSGFAGLMPFYAPYAIVASTGDSVATFNYSFKLVQLPIMLGQTVVQLVLLPWLVAHWRKTPSDHAPVGVALQSAWLVSFCMALCLSLVAQPVAALFFSYGKMTGDDISNIGSLFAIGVWALPGMLLMTVWQTIFYSQQRAFAPLVGNLFQAGLVVPLCWLGHRYGGLQGMFIAFVAVQFFCVLLLAVLGYRGGLSQRYVPSWLYFTMTFAVILVSLPLAYVFFTVALTAWLSLILAVVGGAVMLSAGAMASLVLRHHFTTWITRENHPDHQRS